MPKILLVTFSILVSLICLIMLTSFIATNLFNNSVEKEVKEFFSGRTGNKNQIITIADLQGLPQCVQKWLERSQVIGKERIATVRLKQKGLMRLKEGHSWMSAEAEQYFTVDKPGFIWKAKVRMAPLVYFTGRDKYFDGKGKMLIKALSLFPVAASEGKEMDQGTLLRYLAEMQWFPTAALNDYIKWEEIDSNSARATMSYKGVTASGIFTFNEKGDLVEFSAKRYREANGKYVLTDWGGRTTEYREFNGIRISNKCDIFWKLDTGEFNWFKCEITDIEYNKPILY